MKMGIHRRGGKPSEFREDPSVRGETALANLDSRFRGKDGSGLSAGCLSRQQVKFNGDLLPGKWLAQVDLLAVFSLVSEIGFRHDPGASDTHRGIPHSGEQQRIEYSESGFLPFGRCVG